MILTFITDYMGSQPRDVVCGAADEILQVMKNESLQVCLITTCSMPIFVGFHSSDSLMSRLFGLH
jgi:pre-mRNA-splicing helicase BRR2